MIHVADTVIRNVAFFKNAGHCTRCEAPFKGNTATAFMVRESVAWTVVGDTALTQPETAPVCEPCLTIAEQARTWSESVCKGCGLAVMADRGRYDRWLRREDSCSERCDQRILRKRKAGRRATVKCECCGKSFRPARSDAKFCSAACRQLAYRRRASDVEALLAAATPSIAA